MQFGMTSTLVRQGEIIFWNLLFYKLVDAVQFSMYCMHPENGLIGLMPPRSDLTMSWSMDVSFGLETFYNLHLSNE